MLMQMYTNKNRVLKELDELEKVVDETVLKYF